MRAHDDPQHGRFVGRSCLRGRSPLAQTALPPGAVALINQDRHGSRVALCADTGEPPVQQGARKIRGTAVWVGRGHESPAHSRRTGRLRSCVVARRPASGGDCGRGSVGVSRQFVRRSAARRIAAAARLDRVQLSRVFEPALVARRRAASGWSSPTAARRGWRCSRPTAAGSSTRLRPSTTPSAGRPRAS